MKHTEFDVAVVGGGGAGLSAAAAAATTGAPTALLDSPDIHPSRPQDDPGCLDGPRRLAIDAGVTLYDDTIVWGISAEHSVGAVGPTGPFAIWAKRIVLATGADRVLTPSSGWTQPDIQLALMAECAAGYSDPLGGWVPGRTRHLVTSNSAILVAGDCAGLCTPDVAEAEGWLAGLTAALELGHGSEKARSAARAALERLAPERTAAAADLAASYVQGHGAQAIPADAFLDIYADFPSNAPVPEGAPVICACEDVGEAAVVAAVSDGSRSLNDVKRRTRAGMGVCQGLMCGRPIAHLIARETGMALGDIPPMTARPPVRLTRLADLAGLRGSHSSTGQDAGVHST